MENNTNIKEQEFKDLEVDKKVIENLAKNLTKQHNSLVELLTTRFAQLEFLYGNLKEYRLDEIISYSELDVIIKKAHGLSVNIIDVKQGLDKLDYTKLFEKYDTYINASQVENADIDLDMIGAEIADEMHVFSRDTSSIGSTLDILVEVYTVEVQVKIDSILRRIKVANDRLDILSAEVKDVLNIDEIKDVVLEEAEKMIDEQTEESGEAKDGE